MALLEELQGRKDEARKNRKEVLTELVKQYGGVRTLALALSRTPEQLYALLSDRRNIGDKLARSIEQKLDLQEGTMDKPPTKTEVIKPIEKKAKITRIPLLSTVQAGMPTDCGDLCFDEHIEVLGELPDGCYGLRVTGDSMSPLIDHGDIVVVDPHRWPKPGDCVVCRSELENLNEATVKRYYPIGFDGTGRETFEARPFNEMYPVMRSVEQKLTVIGTVCKLIKDM